LNASSLELIIIGFFICLLFTCYRISSNRSRVSNTSRGSDFICSNRSRVSNTSRASNRSRGSKG